MHWIKNSIGELFKVVVGLAPAARAAGAVNSTSIDRLGLYSGKLVVQTGATTGAPTSFTVNAKVQHSADGATWVDYTHRSGATVVAPQIVAINEIATVDVDLGAANRYLRVVLTPAFVAGTAPTILTSVSVCLGGPDEVPVN